MSVNPTGRYQPVHQVVELPDGTFKVVVCECDQGGYPWEPDFKKCPVHAEEQAQDALTQADILSGGVA